MSNLEQDLFHALCQIPLIDSHSHIDPLSPTARSLDDLLGYHYFTELAHSTGSPRAAVAAEASPRERVHAVLGALERFDNTVQYAWLLEMMRELFGFSSDRLGAEHADQLWDLTQRTASDPDWERKVWQKSGLERVFLTNDFDDPLRGFDRSRYVPCLRADELVFRLETPEVRSRLAQSSGVEPGDARSLRRALHRLFERFVSAGAKACAVSLPPRFAPLPVSEEALDTALREPEHSATRAMGVFWMLAECCREFGLPFDLMIGVNRGVYRHGVPQGQDLFDQRTSLILYADLFNAFPEVPFCVSLLHSGQSQELAAYAWIFPNVMTHGHWWYANVPAYIEPDLRARLQAVPKVKQLGYYSDAYKLEFVLPKYNMYRRILARRLAEDFIIARGWSESEALGLARLLLHDNAVRIFHL